MCIRDRVGNAGGVGPHVGVGAVRDMALDAVGRALRSLVGAVAVGVDGVAAVGLAVIGGGEVAGVAGGAPGRDVGDEARRVEILDLPVVLGRVVLGPVSYTH